MKKTKLVAFYLPQFHAIPENDKAWGEGFTEWDNVKKGKKIRLNQYQPHVPLNNNYYSLLDLSTMQKQAELASNYGVDAFCFYHYYFKGGKKLLEKPIENWLNNSDINFEYCLSWANEPWSKRWDGSENEVIVEQDYGGKSEWKLHFEYLLPFFKDKRYLRDENGYPVFLIYKPKEIPQLTEMLDYWKTLAKSEEFGSIKFLMQFPQYDCKDIYYFDGIVEFEPANTLNKMFSNNSKKFTYCISHPLDTMFIIKHKLLNVLKNNNLVVFPYNMIVKNNLKNGMDEKTYPGVFTSWDNTARRGKNATVYLGSTPDKFQYFLTEKLKKSNKDLLFINAWNEWAEGAHLEPDEKYGYAYLEAVRNAKESAINYNSK